jgi:hypothetical protein
MLANELEKHLRAAVAAIRIGADDDLALYIDFFARSHPKVMPYLECENDQHRFTHVPYA